MERRRAFCGQQQQRRRLLLVVLLKHLRLPVFQLRPYAFLPVPH